MTEGARPSRARLVAALLVCLALLGERARSHGYGTRPPWVAAGVVRVLAPDDGAYLEVRVQHAGHLGARGARSAADTFHVVRLGTPGAARATPRWMRELARRPLGPGDARVGAGVLARAPVALALAGDELAVADRAGVTVQGLDGAVRRDVPFTALFSPDTLAEAQEEHGRNEVWPFAWLEAPPRTVALFADGATLVVALRAQSGGWSLAALDRATGARRDAGEARRALARAAASPAAPDAAIALEALALENAALRAPARDAAQQDEPRDAAPMSARDVLELARVLRGNRRAPVEAQLVAAHVAARLGAQADLTAARATLGDALRRGDGHPSMDDLLAAALLVGLVDPDDAIALAELAIARGVPELLPSLAALGAAGVPALADAWLAAVSGHWSPYADARAVEARAAALLSDVLLAAPEAATRALGAWVEADVPVREALLRALASVEPDIAHGADVRALVASRLGARFEAALEIEGTPTRAVVGALVGALDAAQAGDLAHATARAARVDALLARLVDVPPVGAGDLAALASRGSARAGDVTQARDLWHAWWARASARMQAAELGAALDAAAGDLDTMAWDVPAVGLQGPLDAVAAAAGVDGWRVLAQALARRGTDLDALGLRSWLRTLGDGPAPVDDSEREARTSLLEALAGG